MVTLPLCDMTMLVAHLGLDDRLMALYSAVINSHVRFFSLTEIWISKEVDVYLTLCVAMHSPKIFPRVLIAQNRLTKRFKTYSYDPFYICRKPSIPLFPRLQFSLKGYDFPTLEKYEIYLNKTLRRWVSSVDSFPLPPKKTLYKVYHPNSTKVKTEFELNHYSRIVCAENVKTVDLPIIFDLVQQNLPEGIELAVEEVGSWM
ncbi:hypothetical protein EGR_06640 [Echinococcus granulosus]|uniref:Small ribosomal subunit protein uS10 domain-containing protein n=1 Tax=Echinococcus granulosus TaxID=6210 RepID=W6UY25_ECHGR|nr:hypothetical protein EGR_06640 [Echinococcus granulosus]EUB58459.1 hypothetical protein EGR_06640 [Echinococcus granulosus]